MIILAIGIGDIAWWRWADARLRTVRYSKIWRTLIGLFVGFELGFVIWFIAFPSSGHHAHLWMPTSLLASVYLWHLLILPIALLGVIAARTVTLVSRGAARLFSKRRASPDDDPITEESFAPPAATALSRREALATAIVALPPLLTAGAVGFAVRQIHEFRINRVELPLRQLPRELDGMTVAHVSDIHVGRFTRPGMLPKIADATNSLRADLVLLTGDLIDIALSDLPAGIDFVRRLDPAHGMFIIEGNHDLIEDPLAFEAEVRKAGLPLLRDESAIVKLRGRDVQVLGMTWGRRDSYIVGAMSRLLPQRQPDAFPILLAHHPHAFDPAAAVGLPLTLAGHTHGGQIMLNERLGAGPAMFRYWSGLYRRNDSALFVSNGIGNWFPLRIGAPAEIVHITLRSANA
jgi:predicted MPP superfamily phosphohydrolase